jgi:hypothetical protein
VTVAETAGVDVGPSGVTLCAGASTVACATGVVTVAETAGVDGGASLETVVGATSVVASATGVETVADTAGVETAADAGSDVGAAGAWAWTATFAPGAPASTLIPDEPMPTPIPTPEESPARAATAGPPNVARATAIAQTTRAAVITAPLFPGLPPPKREYD